MGAAVAEQARSEVKTHPFAEDKWPVNPERVIQARNFDVWVCQRMTGQTQRGWEQKKIKRLLD